MNGTKKEVASFSPEALKEKYRREKRLRADGNSQDAGLIELPRTWRKGGDFAGLEVTR